MTEKRISKRSPIELAASFGISDEDATGATVLNISDGGFCFTSMKKMESGNQFRLSVEIDDEEPIELSVTSVWCKKDVKGHYLHGVRINKVKGQDINRFLDFYKQISKDGS